MRASDQCGSCCFPQRVSHRLALLRNYATCRPRRQRRCGNRSAVTVALRQRHNVWIDMARKTKRLFTIGYEQTPSKAVLDELENAGVKLLVDVRAVASSRRPGFSKNQLAAGLDERGISYLHLQGPRDAEERPRGGAQRQVRSAAQDLFGASEDGAGQGGTRRAVGAGEASRVRSAFSATSATTPIATGNGSPRSSRSATA